MTKRLGFGTAGLRGPLGEGPLHMNVELVELAATAISQWVPPASTVVIGRDARHGSADFANVTARVLHAGGHRVQMFSEPVPTPVVAHRVGSTDAAAGVMVTASHNPATDNGYKVYTAGGGQLLGDDAAVIEASMAALRWPHDVDTTPRGDIEALGRAELDAYLETISTSVGRMETAQRSVVVAYTAMHGVGGTLFQQTLERAGHRVHSVTEQHDPNPDFPTAPFPNPEEPGTLDLVMALADDVDADIILAHDPDADRLAVAIPDEQGWKPLTGDQIGVLLGWYVLVNDSSPRTVASSIVSSTLLGKLASARGVRHVSTLTGFKWLARAGNESAPLVFAYEEALGYSVVPEIRDKDGISAGLAFVNLVAWLDSQGRTVTDVLAEIGEEFGHHLTSQISVRFDGNDPMSAMTAIMDQLRQTPPTQIGSFEMTALDDLERGGDGLDPANVLRFHLDGARLIIRPSGTEPKIKAYLEVVSADYSRANDQLQDLEAGVRSLLQ